MRLYSKANKKMLFIIAGTVLSLAVLIAGFSSCKGESKTTYKVDYNGQKSSFQNACDEYEAGEKVSLIFGMAATDTDYHFYMDGEQINPKYDDDKGYIIEFVMPEHDVSIKWDSKNSMIYEPEKVEGTMLVDYYTATVATAEGDSHRELVLYYYTNDKVKLSVYEQDFNEDEIQTDYLVPYEALDKCKELIKKYKFDEWNDKYEDMGLDGGVTVVKYLNDNGETVRVSTDCMPDDGLSKMGAVGAVLESYVRDEWLVVSD